MICLRHGDVIMDLPRRLILSGPSRGMNLLGRILIFFSLTSVFRLEQGGGRVLYFIRLPTPEEPTGGGGWFFLRSDLVENIQDERGFPRRCTSVRLTPSRTEGPQEFCTQLFFILYQSVGYQKQTEFA